jgi:hypothetical protein
MKSLLKGLANNIRWRIALLLKEKGKLSFIEIVNEFHGEYERNEIWQALKYLSKTGVLLSEKRLKKNIKRVGRPQTTFYSLSTEGRILVRYLEEALEKIREAGPSRPVFYLQESLSKYVIEKRLIKISIFIMTCAMCTVGKGDAE